MPFIHSHACIIWSQHHTSSATAVSAQLFKWTYFQPKDIKDKMGSKALMADSVSRRMRTNDHSLPPLSFLFSFACTHLTILSLLQLQLWLSLTSPFCILISQALPSFLITSSLFLFKSSLVLLVIYSSQWYFSSYYLCILHLNSLPHFVFQDSSGMRLWKRKWFVLADFCLFYYKGKSLWNVK